MLTIFLVYLLFERRKRCDKYKFRQHHIKRGALETFELRQKGSSESSNAHKKYYDLFFFSFFLCTHLFCVYGPGYVFV